ncbi:MAG: hypothetical protein WCA35_25250, partial [Kovacikia sp.]
NGPHILVRGSHTKKKFSQIISLGQRQDQRIIDYYGAENVKAICGEAGFGFAEDPFCFHKATRPVLKDRLILQLIYATKDYGLFKSRQDPSRLKNIFENNC